MSRGSCATYLNVTGKMKKSGMRIGMRLRRSGKKWPNMIVAMMLATERTRKTRKRVNVKCLPCSESEGMLMQRSDAATNAARTPRVRRIKLSSVCAAIAVNRLHNTIPPTTKEAPLERDMVCMRVFLKKRSRVRRYRGQCLYILYCI